jgi:phosphoglycolate phosphatase
LKPIILFDLDGTLIDSTEAILESFRVSFINKNHPIPNDEDIKALVGYPLDIMYSNLGVDEKYVWDFVAEYKKHYREISKQKTELLEFAKESIELASSFATLGVVTTKTARYSKELLEHFEVMHHFEILIGREDVENPKPHKEPIIKALKSLNHQDEIVYMIGDTKLDLISAKSANVIPIGLSCGYGTFEDLKEHTDDIFVNSLESIKHIKKFH